MSKILVIAGRELHACFATPVASVFIVIFLVLQGTLTFNAGQFFDRGQAGLNPFFLFIPWVLRIFTIDMVPALLALLAIGMGIAQRRRRARTTL